MWCDDGSFFLYYLLQQILVQLLVGGKPIEKDKKELRKKPHIIIGTPGRTYDMIVRNYLNFLLFLQDPSKHLQNLFYFF